MNDIHNQEHQVKNESENEKENRHYYNENRFTSEKCDS